MDTNLGNRVLAKIRGTFCDMSPSFRKHSLYCILKIFSRSWAKVNLHLGEFLLACRATVVQPDNKWMRYIGTFQHRPVFKEIMQENSVTIPVFRVMC